MVDWADGLQHLCLVCHFVWGRVCVAQVSTITRVFHVWKSAELEVIVGAEFTGQKEFQVRFKLFQV